MKSLHGSIGMEKKFIIVKKYHGGPLRSQIEPPWYDRLIAAWERLGDDMAKEGFIIFAMGNVIKLDHERTKNS
jgi:hypothetical protein